jgi:hypothetical protein
VIMNVVLLLGIPDYTPTFTIALNFTPGHPRLLTHLHHHFEFPTWAHMITHPLFPSTSNFTPGHLQLPTHFHHHIQFHTWAHVITCPLSPPLSISQLGTSHCLPLSAPLQISQVGTSHYQRNLTTTSHLPPGHF